MTCGRHAQSARNYDTYEYLRRESPSYVDWEITTIFYSACKMVDAYLIKKGHPRPASHKRRNRMVRNNLKAISKEYSNLYRVSRVARYDKRMQVSDRDRAAAWHAFIADKLS